MPQNRQNRLNYVDVCDIVCDWLIENGNYFSQVLLEFVNFLSE